MSFAPVTPTIRVEPSCAAGPRSSATAVRPPVYDSPTTRGLFDPTTGVYWAVDTFATPLPDPFIAIEDLETEFWHFGLRAFARIRELPGLDPPVLPDHSVLDEVVAATSHSPI